MVGAFLNMSWDIHADVNPGSGIVVLLLTVSIWVILISGYSCQHHFIQLFI
jgi:hypothetical protein